MPQSQAIFPANRHSLYTEHKYSAAIKSGDLLFVSGQVGSRKDGSIMKVRSEFFNCEPYPNWTAVGVNWLAGFDFEIKVVARVPQ